MAYAKAGSKVLRISPELHELLNARKPPKITWDAFLRRVFGLRVRKSTLPPLLVRWVLPSGTFRTAAEARGAAIVAAVQARAKEPEQPLKMREVL